MYIVLSLCFMACSDPESESPRDVVDDIQADVDVSSDTVAPVCEWTGPEAPTHLQRLGCQADFDALSSAPLSSGLAGARSVKIVIDRSDDGALFFQNSRTYPLHWDFARAHRSGAGLPLVGDLSSFNETEYTSPDRRFIGGAVTWYEGPGRWVYEIAPYDTASVELISQAMTAIAASSFFGEALAFHPTSVAVEEVARGLPEDIEIVSTDELLTGLDYLPLNLGEAYGKLRFINADTLETSFVDFLDIVVLDRIPLDISPVAATITVELQTPLAHINVLAQNRGTPNMTLRSALTDPRLRELEGRWVKLTVGAQTWTVVEVSQDDALAWWEANRPASVQVPAIDLSVRDLRDLAEMVTIPEDARQLSQAIRGNIPAFGGKAAHYASLLHIGPDVPVRSGFAVPVYYYAQFMEQNGFDKDVAAMLADPTFQGDAATRNRRLANLRTRMIEAPVDGEFMAELEAKVRADFPQTRMRFRSSTNAEDLEGFTGAGLYTSKSGDPDDPDDPLDEAVRKVWASVWNFQAFEERRYRGIDHQAVAMALLVHPTFVGEDASGVALTANIFDSRGLEPGFYVNVQVGDNSVVLPEAGVSSDEFIYQYQQPGQPIIFYRRSSLIPTGESVLSVAETFELGRALDAIHRFYLPAYGPTMAEPERFYAMDVEFKFMPTPEGSKLVIKQARPHPGRGKDLLAED